MATGRIPWTAVDSWARRHRVRGEDFDWLLAAVFAWVDEQMRLEKIERDKDKPKGKG